MKYVLSEAAKKAAEHLMHLELTARPRKAWLESCLKQEPFVTAVRRARTGAGADRAFDSSSRAHAVVLKVASEGGIREVARARPETVALVETLEVVDHKSIVSTAAKRGSAEAAWLVFGHVELDTISEYDELFAAVVAPLPTDEPNVLPANVERTAVPTPHSDPDQRLQKLWQSVEDLKKALKRRTKAEQERELRALPVFLKLQQQVADHAKRLKQVESAVVRTLPDRVSRVQQELSRTIEREYRRVAKESTAKYDRLEKLIRDEMKASRTDLNALKARVSELERERQEPVAMMPLDELESRIGAVEARFARVVEALAGVPVPPPAELQGTEPVETEQPESESRLEAQPASAVPPRLVSVMATRRDQLSEKRRTEAARTLRSAARRALSGIGLPDVLVIDGHNVVIPALDAEGFRDEREAREWLIHHVDLLADTLGLDRVFVMLDTPLPTQRISTVSSRVELQFCGPDIGKADGGIVKVIEDLIIPGTSIVVCSGDHGVEAAAHGLIGDGHRIRVLDRQPLLDLLLALERYLDEYLDFDEEIALELVREELVEVNLVEFDAITAPMTAEVGQKRPPESQPTALVEWFTERIKVEPAQASLYIGRARRLLTLGRIEEARADLDEASRLNPSAPGLEQLRQAATGARPLAAALGKHIPGRIPPEVTGQWAESVRAGDMVQAKSLIDQAEQQGARHPYLTLAMAATAIAASDSEAAREILSRFDTDERANTNMRMQAELMRLLAGAVGTGSPVELSQLDEAVSRLQVPAFSLMAGAVGYFIPPLESRGDVLAESVRVIRERFGDRGRTQLTAEQAVDVKRLLQEAGTALSQGSVEDAQRHYDALERAGITEDHIAMNRALIAIARGRSADAREAIERYRAVALLGKRLLLLETLEQLTNAIDGEVIDTSHIERLRAGIPDFVPIRTPIAYLGRYLRRGGAAPEVERVLVAFGL